MESYFNYFTEIEEHFQRRRGSALLLSTLDWALIETWKDAGIPLQAVLRGIDQTFEKYERRPSKTRKVNSLAYCSQEVLAAAEEMKQSAVGAAPSQAVEDSAAKQTGFHVEQVAQYLEGNAARLQAAGLPAGAQSLASNAARSLRELASGLRLAGGANLEDIERRMTAMEEKLFGALIAATADEALVAVRAEADRDLAPYRSKMTGPHIEQLHKQYVHKRLLEQFNLPRLSLFYMAP